MAEWNATKESSKSPEDKNEEYSMTAGPVIEFACV